MVSILQITLIISLFLISLSSPLLASVDCRSDRPVIFTKGNKQIRKKLDFCTNYPIYKIISSGCLHSKGCEALKKYQFSTMPLITSSFGNPLHHKCTILGGTPTLVSVEIDKLNQQTALCFFKDGSFISVFNDL